MIFSFQQTYEKCIEPNTTLYNDLLHDTVDFTKTFDTVNKETL